MAEEAITVTVRLAGPSDLAAVDALLARSYPRQLKADYPPSIMVAAVPIIARARPELLASGTYFLAETEAGEVIAAGGWTPRRRTGQGEVRHVVTDDRWTRRGVASAVLQAALTQARARGIGVMTCMATRTAVRFYQAQGFQIMGPVDVPLSGGIPFPAIQMQKHL